MRPFKHVARDGDSARYQNILGIDVARFRAPWGDVPVVATTETDRITLYYWDDRASRWALFERPHEPLTFSGDNTDAPASWNWSDRVAVACSPSTVYVVSKRHHPPEQAAITLERYQPESAQGSNNHRLKFVDSRVLEQDAPPRFDQFGQQIGRSLWAGWSESTRELLVLFQRRIVSGIFQTSPWKLVLLRISIDVNGDMSSRSTDVGDGGFDLDAGLDLTRLLAVYRSTSEAFRIPMVTLLGGRQLTSGTDADPFYEPLQLTIINTDSMHLVTEEIPGGEHPQIQRTAPLLITMDRPARLDLALDTPILPLPPRRPRAIWDESGTDKIAFLRDGADTFRGTLLTSDASTIPRSHAAMNLATHLFENRNGLLVHAAPFAHFPVQVLTMTRDRKGVTLDVLHHRDFIGLFRTRLHATLSNGVLTVSDRAFEVWDIGHGQIGDPNALVPGADGETAQFAPSEQLALTASGAATTRPVNADNTMGGHLVADIAHEPVGFFAYTDLGDGCLRVIFANDIPALGDPPPIDSEKVLRPEQVTGPHLACDQWIELRAPDFVDSELIGYGVGILHANRSLGSALEVPIDFLLDACTLVNADGCFAGDPPLDSAIGLSPAQLTNIDALRVRLAPALAIPLTLSDGRNVTVTVTFHEPMGRCPDSAVGALVERLPATLSVDLGGAAPAALWTLTPGGIATAFLPPGPVLPGAVSFLPGGQLQQVATGNPATVIPPAAGPWRLSVFIVDGSGTPAPGAAADIEIQDSTYSMLTALYRAVSRGEFYRMGNLNLSALQYAITYQADVADQPSIITIVPQAKRKTEIRFRGNGPRQGFVEYAAILSFSTDQMKLRYGLDLLFDVKEFELTLHYGRPFTAGMLMSDRRTRDVLDGHLLDDNGNDEVQRRDSRRHASIGAKPLENATIYGYESVIDVAMTLGGVAIPSLLAALTIIGAFSIAQTIISLTAAAAAAAALGVIGIVVAILVGIALAIFIAVAVPPAVEKFMTDRLDEQISSGSVLAQLNDQPILRYAGEGAAEAIARKALTAALDQGFTVPPPAALDTDEAGQDRSYGQIFQMVFVSEGLCRVLLRLDDCLGEVEPTLPTPPSPPAPPPGPPDVTPGG